MISIGASAAAQEPPETAGEDAAEEDDGVEEGCCKLLDEPELVVVLVLELELVLVDGDRDACVAVALAVLVVPCPWNERAAASETPPVATTAAAISHRLIRLIRANPASLALTAFLLTTAILAVSCKKTLNQL